MRRMPAGYQRHMARCDVCDNEYDRTFTVDMPDDRSGTFDSFECAIHAFAPTCAHCGCRVIGHGVEADGTVYCCASCARHAEGAEISDRVDADQGIDPTRPTSNS